jgi:hypothetical protein
MAPVDVRFTPKSGHSHLLHSRRRPLTVQDRLVGPIGANVKRERTVRCGQPITFLIGAGRFGTGIERQRTISVVFEGLVLGAERIAIKRVRAEEMILVVKC